MLLGSIDAQWTSCLRVASQRIAKTRQGCDSYLRRCAITLTFVTALACPIASTTNAQQALLRVAVVGFAHSSSRDLAARSNDIENRLGAALSSDQRVMLVDGSIVRSALLGLGYDGSINMNRDEARRVGSAIGCDFFITGKLEAITRSAEKGESHEEAIAGVMLVDGRTGDLACFDFISEKATTTEAALKAVEKAMIDRAAKYVDRISQIRVTSQAAVSATPVNSSRTAELIEDMPDEDSPRAAGFKPPQFLVRVKPAYTVQAEQADITATVEAMVVFRANGEIGPIEITRWAGFGLDESAAEAARRFKFLPAQRNGIPLNVRAMIRYNFKRVNDVSQQPEAPAPEPPTKPGRDLRPIFKRTYRRP